MAPTRLHILSDLHLEHAAFAYTSPNQGADIVILAGDIASANEVGQKQLRQLLSGVCTDGRHIVMVPGNHEFYGSDIDYQLVKLHALAGEYPNFTVLECETATVQGLVISGCTLWTDFSLENSSNGGIRAEACVADFRCISHAGKPITWRGMAERYLHSVKFLEKNAPGSDIVITHFLPSPQSISEKHESSNLNSYFASDLTHLISQVNGLWIHGHSHSSCDYTEGSCRVICNPRGYGKENSDFDPEFTVALEGRQYARLPAP